MISKVCVETVLLTDFYFSSNSDLVLVSIAFIPKNIFSLFKKLSYIYIYINYWFSLNGILHLRDVGQE